MLVSAGTVYYATEKFGKEKDEKRKKQTLILTILVNVGILAVLKYTNLGIHTVSAYIKSVRTNTTLPKKTNNCKHSIQQPDQL